MKRRGFLSLLAAPFVAAVMPKPIVNCMKRVGTLFGRPVLVDTSIYPEIGADGGYLVPEEFAKVMYVSHDKVWTSWHIVSIPCPHDMQDVARQRGVEFKYDPPPIIDQRQLDELVAKLKAKYGAT